MDKRRMIWVLVIAAGLLMFLEPGATRAGWREDRQWKYVEADGSYKTSEWFTDESGKTYYLDQEGNMVRGWHQDSDGAWYFFDQHGVLVRGSVQIDGLLYYFLENGSLYEGEKIAGGEKVLFSRDGAACPDGLFGYAAAYNSDGVLYRESGEYDKENPGYYLFFFVLLAIGVVMGWWGKRTNQEYEMIFVFVAVFLSSTPLMLRYIANGQDLIFHLNRILGIEKSLEGGMFPVRINGFTFGGYGYPDPIFYPQLFLYIPALLHIAGVPFTASVHTFLLLVNWATAMVMFLCAKRLSGSSQIGAVSSMIYTMAVYRLCNEYTRAAYGELLAMTFFPLVLWGMYELFYGQEQKWLLLPLAFTGIFQSHLISTVLVAIGCVIFGVIAIRRLRERGRILALGKVVFFTLCLNLWTLVPLLQYLFTDIDTSSLRFAAEERAVHLPLLVEIFSRAAGSSPQFSADLSDVMPLSLGLVIFCGILVLFVLIFIKRETVPPKIHVCLWSGIGLVIVSSNLFPWHFLARLPLAKMAASYIQFPWRLLAMGICFLSIAVGYGWNQCMKEKGELGLYLTVLVLAMVSSQYYIDSYNETGAKIWTEYNVTSEVGKSEYLYEGTETGNLLGQVSGSENVVVTGIKKEGLSVCCSYVIQAKEEGAYIDLPLLYFPGYTGTDQKGQKLMAERGENNRIRVFLKQPEGEIHVFFQEPILWRGMELLFLAAVAWLIGKYGLRLRH